MTTRTMAPGGGEGATLGSRSGRCVWCLWGGEGHTARRAVWSAHARSRHATDARNRGTPNCAPKHIHTHLKCSRDTRPNFRRKS